MDAPPKAYIRAQSDNVGTCAAANQIKPPDGLLDKTTAARETHPCAAGAVKPPCLAGSLPFAPYLSCNRLLNLLKKFCFRLQLSSFPFQLLWRSHSECLSGICLREVYRQHSALGKAINARRTSATLDLISSIYQRCTGSVACTVCCVISLQAGRLYTPDLSDG